LFLQRRRAISGSRQSRAFAGGLTPEDWANSGRLRIEYIERLHTSTWVQMRRNEVIVADLEHLPERQVG